MACMSMDPTGTRPENAAIRIERAFPASPDDAIVLIEEYYEAIGVIKREDRVGILEYLRDRHSAVWVAYLEDRAAGCILYRPLTHLPRSGELKRLYVRPAFRGLGIANSLLDEAERFARRENVHTLYLDSKDDLYAALRFYERHGYRRCERYNDNPQATIFMQRCIVPQVSFRYFAPEDAEVFRKLNEAWISEHFVIEEKDRLTLADPQRYILKPGGQILLGTVDGEVVACCAMLRKADASFEVGKMTVAKELRGFGIGRRLLEQVIQWARERGILRLYLETNSKLQDAIHLYEQVGFVHIPKERIVPSPYTRANVFMEMWLRPLR